MILYITRLLTLISLLLISQAKANEPVLLNLSLPDIDWAVQLKLEGFQVDQQRFYPGMKGRSFEASNMDTGLVVSVFIEPAVKSGDAREFRKYTFKNLKRSSFDFEDVREYERDSAAFLEYTLSALKDRTDWDQRNTYMFMVRQDWWITVHLSRMKFLPDDQKLFDDFFSAVKILENYTPGSIDHFVFGSQYYRDNDFAGAAKHYQMALDLEKDQKYLPEVLWLVLVDNLAMSYGIPGDHEKAKEILLYGLSLKPDYPMFHYNLACTYAETDQTEKALACLARAYEQRANMIEGEVMPDPAEDPSFQGLKDDPRFRELLSTWGE